MENCENEYSGFFAEFYDILQGNAEELSGYCDLIKYYNSDSILEIGCGSGRLLIPLAKKGYKITGIDLSEDMLNICRDKLKAEESNLKRRVNLVNADMRNFQLEQKYDFIFTAYNTIFHLLTIEDLNKFFKRIKKHLADDGVFIIDIRAPNVEEMLNTDGKEEVTEFIHPDKGTKIVSHFSSEYDILNQRETDKIVLKEFDKKNLLRVAKTEVELTFFWPRELKMMLDKFGFEILEEYGSLEGEPLTSNSNEIIMIATC